MSITRREFLLSASLASAGVSLPSLASAANEPVPPFQPDDWESVRSQFALSKKHINFASFFIASHPKPVRDAIERLRQQIDEDPFLTVNNGMFGTDTQNLQHPVREAAADYLGGKPEEVCLTSNTTTGLALIYHGLSLRPGDEVLTTIHDHYAHHESIRLATNRVGASMRKVTLFDHHEDISIDQIIERLRSAIKANTRVIGVTWVHSSSGLRLPIRAIADALAEINRKRTKNNRVLLVVDGVHGLGAVDETVAEMGMDFFAAGTHKWLFAPRGTGLIWAKAENWARLTPVIPTFSGQEPYEAWKHNKTPKGPTKADWITPGGFYAYEHQWAMPAAFHFHQQIGRKRIAERIQALNGYIKQGLEKIPGITVYTPKDPKLSAGIVSFSVHGKKNEEVIDYLLKNNILASISPYGNAYLRLAAGIMNTGEEVESVLKALRSLR
jgi:isopenicillin-N epimerase